MEATKDNEEQRKRRTGKAIEFVPLVVEVPVKPWVKAWVLAGLGQAEPLEVTNGTFLGALTGYMSMKMPNRVLSACAKKPRADTLQILMPARWRVQRLDADRITFLGLLIERAAREEFLKQVALLMRVDVHLSESEAVRLVVAHNGVAEVWDVDNARKMWRDGRGRFFSTGMSGQLTLGI
jgi:hypothetical protein